MVVVAAVESENDLLGPAKSKDEHSKQGLYFRWGSRVVRQQKFNASIDLEYIPQKVLQNYEVVREIFKSLKEFHGEWFVAQADVVFDVIRRIPDNVIHYPLVFQTYLEEVQLGDLTVDAELNHFDFLA